MANTCWRLRACECVVNHTLTLRHVKVSFNCAVYHMHASLPPPATRKSNNINTHKHTLIHTHTHIHTHLLLWFFPLRCACCCLLEVLPASLVVLAIRLALFFLCDTHTHICTVHAKHFSFFLMHFTSNLTFCPKHAAICAC